MTSNLNVLNCFSEVGDNNLFGIKSRKYRIRKFPKLSFDLAAGQGFQTLACMDLNFDRAHNLLCLRTLDNAVRNIAQSGQVFIAPHGEKISLHIFKKSICLKHFLIKAIFQVENRRWDRLEF